MGTIRTFAEVERALGFMLLIPQPVPGDPLSAADVFFNTFVFQYFPETMSDSQSANYQAIDIPGGSHPLQQWISGGPRILSCECKLSSERIIPPGAVDVGNRHNIDINGALAMLRFFLYPRYDATNDLRAIAPPRIWLVIPGSFYLNPPLPVVSVLLKDLRIDIKAWHAPGIPRLANVSLTFEETVQSTTGITYVGRDNFLFPKVLYNPALIAAKRAFGST